MPAQLSASIAGTAADAEVGAARQARGNLLLLLYLFTFLSQFKPSEPFLVDYLVGVKGFTEHQVTESIFDLYVYARLPLLLLTGLASELPCCGARGVLLAGATCSAATVLLTRFTDALWAQQLAQITVAASFVSRYAVAPVAFTLALPSEFQQNIHTVKAVLLLSNSCSALLGEVLRDVARVPLDVLFDVSATCQVLALLPSLWLLVGGRQLTLQEASRPLNGLMPDLAAPVVVATPPCAPAVAAARDLWLSVLLRGVASWTVWAVTMDTAHGLALTYWQSLLHSKRIENDHNGYVVAGMYLVAAALVAASRRAAALREYSTWTVIFSMVAAGLTLCALAEEARQWFFYCWLLAFQCIFEVATAVATYQVGAEVMRVSAAASAGPSSCQGAALLPKKARLTLLFSATGVLSGGASSVAQAALHSWRSVATRFWVLGLALGALALIIALVGASGAVVRRCCRATAMTGRQERLCVASGDEN